MEGHDCCCHKTKTRSEEEYKSLIHRLNRIEGQIRGIRGMVEKSAYCTDILTQVAAANAALNAAAIQRRFTSVRDFHALRGFIRAAVSVRVLMLRRRGQINFSHWFYPPCDNLQR